MSDISICEKITKSIRYGYDAWRDGQYSGILICGDFNFSRVNWFNDGSCQQINQSDLSASYFIDCLDDCFIHQNVIKPTFQTSFGAESN